MNATLPLVATKWTIDSDQSDVLIKARHSIIAYIAGSLNKFNGHLNIHEDEIEDASVEFQLDLNNKGINGNDRYTNLIVNDYLDIDTFPFINFKSTSFQKISKNINFLKGNLTIKNITKVVELDAALISITSYEGTRKALFEITGQINRSDFDLTTNYLAQTTRTALGQNIKLIANLEFTI
ncbi:YceI family protein [Flavobacterium sp. ACAM 123]|jgi:polyisoprenoid-binding protein YceI|uniref:YceI family protein n=1 Tax=Flavobacterium sp. ACAM 123 TaxID=1189620 RepID=UPI0002D6E781|nr:YceI family protein [Flavobacterium sp. ACAM 123]